MASIKKIGRDFISHSYESKMLKPKCHSVGSFSAVWIMCILAFSKDRYRQCNRFQISVEPTVAVYNYKSKAGVKVLLVPCGYQRYISIQIILFVELGRQAGKQDIKINK